MAPNAANVQRFLDSFAVIEPEPAAKAEPAADWKEIKSAECGFRVQMPAEPRTLLEKTEQGVEIRRFVVADPQTELNFIVAHYRLTDKMLKEKPKLEERLEFLREGTVAGHKLVSQKPLQTPGGAGEELELRTSQGATMLVRQYAVGESMYQCGVGGAPDKVRAQTKSVRRFLDSFAFLAGPAPSSGEATDKAPSQLAPPALAEEERAA